MIPRVTILVVEDDPLTVRLLESHLHALGHELAGAVPTGEEALIFLAGRHVDLVVMDVGLAGALDGVETAERMRDVGAVPVVFLTVRDDVSTIERIQRTLPFGFLVKPPQREQLGAAIAIAMRGHALETRVRSSEAGLSAILDGIADAVIAVDPGGIVLLLNTSAERLSGWSRGEGEGLALGRLLTIIEARGEQGQPTAMGWERIAEFTRAPAPPCWLTLRVRDGALRHVRFTALPMAGAPGAGAVLLLQDLTQHRRAELAMRRMGRSLQVLSEAAQALHRAASEHDLLGEVCRIVVARGGYRLAWVGTADQGPARAVLPVVMAGLRTEDIVRLRIGWGDDRAAAHPAGTSIKTGAIAIARLDEDDGTFPEWRATAASRGLAAIISLPLRVAGGSFAVLIICSADVGAFDHDEVDLLRELAENLSYGVQALRTRLERQRAEQDLLMAEARYRTLIEQIPIVTYIAALDDCSSMLYLSPQIARLTGYPPESWITNPAFYVNRLLPADRMRVLTARAKAVQDRQPLAIEYRLLAADGRVVWVADEAQVVTGDPARGQFVHGVLTDVTSRKSAEESLQRAHDILRTMIQGSPLAIYIVDGAGLVQSVWNPAAERLFGWREDEVMGQPLPIVDAEAQREFRLLRERAMAGETLLGIEVKRRRRDGTPVYLNLAVAPLRGGDGAIGSMVAMVADITERKRAEAALAAAQRDATVGRMAAVVAHEVNNPIAAIKAWLGLLRSDLAHLPDVSRNLVMIGEQVDRIARTVRNLLGFARQRETGDGRVQATPLIRTVADLFAGRMKAKGIRFAVEVPDDLPVLSGDADQLQEVLINLLENACQALDRGSHVRLAARLDEQRLSIAIEDDGPGLGEDPQKLFTPFFTTKVNGTGLGLTVARRICEAHGGELQAANLPTGGAAFRILLPVNERSRPVGAPG